ncbi:helix-turn-helix domain-containing protein [Listeria booriae]|uniref:Helix-turn-helix domain-containing protein n=1 Tax=Listeria booriae TaxID=1552123 RepID=A0A7X1DTH2_9LIST|nr:helix-turn-helix domain-containing protein [Listeria booriae]MBC2373648.1 helix-turn-helix domain-containing protein [Listeria booriae]
MGLERLNNYQTFETEKELRETVDTYLADYRLNTSTRLVLEYITACAIRYNGACTIYRETIATKINMTVTTVSRALRTLRELDMIAVIPSYRKSVNGGRGASIFQILASVTQHVSKDDTHQQSKNNAEKPVIPNNELAEKTDVSLFSNLSLTSSRQLSKFSDAIIHSTFIECSKEPGMNKALFQKVLTEVQIQELRVPIANPASYLRAAVNNALQASQVKKERAITDMPKSVQSQMFNKHSSRKEVLPDWFDTSAAKTEQKLPKKSKEQLQHEVDAMRRKLRGEPV